MVLIYQVRFLALTLSYESTYNYLAPYHLAWDIICASWLDRLPDIYIELYILPFSQIVDPFA